MAIAEWSWQTSNGTASAAQTKAAYNALIGKDYTEKFSRLVWNDLCAKVREVALAVKGEWYAYGGVSYSSMLMNTAYGDLTSGRFNALRQNTQYPSWSWAYDRESEGYTGRTDFRGVADYGEFNSDFVYGVYFIELTRRLNQIIRILNGTEPVYPLTAPARLVLTSTPALIVLPPSVITAPERIRLESESGLSELPGAALLNRFLINGPVIRAEMETGRFSDYEARLNLSLSYTRRLRQFPSAPLKVSPGAVVTAMLFGELLPAVNAVARISPVVSYRSFAEKRPGVSIISSNAAFLGASAGITKQPPAVIDPVYAYSILRPRGWLDSKKPCDLKTDVRLWSGVTGAMVQAEPLRTFASGNERLTSDALLQQTDEFRSLRAAWQSSIGSEAVIGILENGLPVSASGISRVIPAAVPTVRRYAYARSSVSIIVSYYALLQIDTTWEYPIHIGDDLSFTQVWQTEENNVHLFWDHDNAFNRTDMAASFSAVPAQLLPVRFGISAGCALNCHPAANTFRSSDWEHPVQTGAELFIPQSEQHKTKKHRLEVK